MGKSKGKRLRKPSLEHRIRHTKSAPFKKDPVKKAKAPASQQRPTIPFESIHRILLVGEGDFSFSHSLLEHHGCKKVHATSFDTRSTVLSKYPQVATHTQALEAEGCKVEYGVDATKLGHGGGNGGGKDVRKGGWDRIVFNFPHVGGLTKDVNRQVRANQELLVGFFQSALPMLSPNGHIVITMFEGEPYELWNVRDLARHSSLRVEQSFRFQADAYPGYKHTRTLGNIEGGGRWKGEDRPARTYILADKSVQPEETAKKRKRADADSESD